MRFEIWQNKYGYYVCNETSLFWYLNTDGTRSESAIYYSSLADAIDIATKYKHSIVKFGKHDDVQPIPSGSSTPTQDTDTRTIKQLATNAILAQSACNLIAVVKSFDRDLRRLRTLLNLDTDSLRFHPIAVLYADKIADMTGRGDTYSAAYTECEKLGND